MSPIHLFPQDSAWGVAHSSFVVNLEGGKEKNEGKVGGKETRPGS